MQIDPRIKSRPLYDPVVIRPKAKKHLFIGAGAELDALYASLPQEQCIRVAGGADGLTEALRAELDKVFETLPLASAVYVCGSEGFMWDIRNLSLAAGLADEQVQMCEPTTKERRLFCTHCYEITEGVTHSPQACSACGRLLLVRDHYSKLHGAYVGVQINAEDPADIPETEELV
ncbi:dimethylamine monooxygenase subunit DmmA family protein [Marinobacterium lutimaris]|uniref:Dimethylamine monooxygenase subunit DmmA-like C-terminal domain-containing protein n=1 Tax=Marinobacterium lutimaris TaxID=568106 RepID=A0A1H6B7S2_9GAMM|nr:dimethylamine monooxygenase subunit DmmA family protein [Marinobacterium lutimaris]SEG56662.1 hypothetical protein SAMN05444390_102451 [Marinobacterium lutimaris]